MLEEHIKQNYRDLVTSGASTWPLVEEAARLQGDSGAALAAFAAEQTEAGQKRAAETTSGEAPKGRRSAARETAQG